MANSKKYKLWHAKKVQEILQKETLAQKVDKQMNSVNLKVEVKDENGKWIDE